MAYKFYQPAHPDPGTDNGQQALDYIRDNQEALNDGILIADMFNERVEAVYGSDPELPDYYLKKRGQVWLRITPTRNADGDVTSSLYEKSLDGGQSWESIKRKVITRDAQGNFQNSDWSDP